MPYGFNFPFLFLHFLALTQCKSFCAPGREFLSTWPVGCSQLSHVAMSQPCHTSTAWSAVFLLLAWRFTSLADGFLQFLKHYGFHFLFRQICFPGFPRSIFSIAMACATSGGGCTGTGEETVCRAQLPCHWCRAAWYISAVHNRYGSPRKCKSSTTQRRR